MTTVSEVPMLSAALQADIQKYNEDYAGGDTPALKKPEARAAKPYVPLEELKYDTILGCKLNYSDIKSAARKLFGYKLTIQEVKALTNTTKAALPYVAAGAVALAAIAAGVYYQAELVNAGYEALYSLNLLTRPVEASTAEKVVNVVSGAFSFLAGKVGL